NIELESESELVADGELESESELVIAKLRSKSKKCINNEIESSNSEYSENNTD
ncbi:8_t:CDS:1, partial [Racocetra persica]